MEFRAKKQECHGGDNHAGTAYYVNLEYVNLYIEYKTYIFLVCGKISINYHYYLNKKYLTNRDIGMLIFKATPQKMTYYKRYAYTSDFSLSYKQSVVLFVFHTTICAFKISFKVSLILFLNELKVI